MSAEFRFTYDTHALFCNNKAYILPTEDLFLLGIFSSKVMQFFAIHNVAKIRGDSYCLYAHYVSKFPIPRAGDLEKDHLRKVTATILARLQTDPATDVSTEERKINEIVYDMYGLSQHERELIENDIRRRSC